MRKLVHNGLLYVESEEGEKSMKKEFRSLNLIFEKK